MPRAIDPDEIRILVATDNHLGYLEKDPIRGQDSFYAFEEIFQLAVIKNADFVLLGGDIFHFNQPSRACMHKAMNIIKKYCFGDRKSTFEYKSDPVLNFGSNLGKANFQDPTMKISMPVFTIHGNHDDPSGEGSLSAIDILSDAGLLNYFGKTQSIDEIVLEPILLKKNNTRVAIYGIGSIRDERLYRTMANKKLKMNRPTEHKDDWFNIMTIHQNRVPHGRTNFIPEEFLEGFLDVVIWGHEHECLIDPQPNPTKKFYVIQPGSSVATSLSDGEAREKYVCLMKVNGKEFQLEKLRLQNVRPFTMTTVALSQVPEIKRFSTEGKIIEYLSRVLQNELKLAKRKFKAQLVERVEGVTNFLGPNPKPLIRIRVDYSGGFEPFFAHKFGINFVEIVANPRDILLFYKRQRSRFLMGGEEHDAEEEKSEQEESGTSGSSKARMSQMVESFIKAQDLKVFVDLELHNAVRQFVDKGDNNAIGTFVHNSLKNSRNDVKKYKPNTLEEIICFIQEVQSKRRSKVVKDFDFEDHKENQEFDHKKDFKGKLKIEADELGEDSNTVAPPKWIKSENKGYSAMEDEDESKDDNVVPNLPQPPRRNQKTVKSEHLESYGSIDRYPNDINSEKEDSDEEFATKEFVLETKTQGVSKPRVKPKSGTLDTAVAATKAGRGRGRGRGKSAAAKTTHVASSRRVKTEEDSTPSLNNYFKVNSSQNEESSDLELREIDNSVSASIPINNQGGLDTEARSFETRTLRRPRREAKEKAQKINKEAAIVIGETSSEEEPKPKTSDHSMNFHIADEQSSDFDGREGGYTNMAKRKRAATRKRTAQSKPAQKPVALYSSSQDRLSRQTTMNIMGGNKVSDRSYSKAAKISSHNDDDEEQDEDEDDEPGNSFAKFSFKQRF